MNELENIKTLMDNFFAKADKFIVEHKEKEQR